jgi:hypothetical protein
MNDQTPTPNETIVTPDPNEEYADIKSVLLDLLDRSHLNTVQKNFVRLVFIEHRIPGKKLEEKFKDDPKIKRTKLLPYLYGNLDMGENWDPQKEMYLQFIPIAILQEIILLLSSKNKEVVLTVAKDMQDRVSEVNQTKSKLPVNMIINLPPNATPAIKGEITEEENKE